MATVERLPVTMLAACELVGAVTPSALNSVVKD